MGLVDGTRELMRHDLEVWPPEAGAVWRSEVGITRRGFLVGAGFAAASWRWPAASPGASRRGMTGSAPPATSSAWRSPAPRAQCTTYTLDSRYVDEPVGYRIAWPPGTEPGDPLPVCFALPGRGGGPPMGFADYVAAAVREDESPPYAVVGVEGGVRPTGIRAHPARTAWACCSTS